MRVVACDVSSDGLGVDWQFVNLELACDEAISSRINILLDKVFVVLTL